MKDSSKNQHCGRTEHMEDKKTLKVKCFITGEESIFSGDYLNKLIERYGSRENILKYYITYRAKNFLFKGYTIPEIRKILLLKKTELEDPSSPKGIELIKYWQDQKNLKVKYKMKDQKDNVSFIKTDPEVKDFINNWIKSKKIE